MLEHHADLPVAQAAQPALVHSEDVVPIHRERAGRGLDETVDHPQDGGFPGARQAHDDEELTALDGEVHVMGAEKASRRAHRRSCASSSALEDGCSLVVHEAVDLAQASRFDHDAGPWRARHLPAPPWIISAAGAPSTDFTPSSQASSWSGFATIHS